MNRQSVSGLETEMPVTIVQTAYDVSYRRPYFTSYLHNCQILGRSFPLVVSCTAEDLSHPGH